MVKFSTKKYTITVNQSEYEVWKAGNIYDTIDITVDKDNEKPSLISVPISMMREVEREVEEKGLPQVKFEIEENQENSPAALGAAGEPEAKPEPSEEPEVKEPEVRTMEIEVDRLQISGHGVNETIDLVPFDKPPMAYMLDDDNLLVRGVDKVMRLPAVQELSENGRVEMVQCAESKEIMLHINVDDRSIYLGEDWIFEHLRQQEIDKPREGGMTANTPDDYLDSYRLNRVIAGVESVLKEEVFEDDNHLSLALSLYSKVDMSLTETCEYLGIEDKTGAGLVAYIEQLHDAEKEKSTENENEHEEDNSRHRGRELA